MTPQQLSELIQNPQVLHSALDAVASPPVKEQLLRMLRPLSWLLMLQLGATVVAGVGAWLAAWAGLRGSRRSRETLRELESVRAELTARLKADLDRLEAKMPPGLG